jgi:hypothetical protein
MQASPPTYRYTHPSKHTLTNWAPSHTHQHTHQHSYITSPGRKHPDISMVLKGWRVLCGCPLALPMSPVSLPGDVHTCRPFRRPNTSLLSSPLLLSWRLAVSRPSHSPSGLMGPPVHGPSKRLQGRVRLGAWLGRERGSLASHKRGVGSSDSVWGTDWAAVVSPSPREEASAKQVLPWRDRHGPLQGWMTRPLWAPLCVSGRSHGCAVQPLQRPVTVASARQTSHTLCLLWYSPPRDLILPYLGPGTYMSVYIGIAHRSQVRKHACP